MMKGFVTRPSPPPTGSASPGITLLHFTPTAKAIPAILQNGFAYVALPTKVATFVLPANIPGDREPQQFGMVCFRAQMAGEDLTAHRKRFGNYAIAMDLAWAKSVHAQPVLYVVPESPVSTALRRLMGRAAGTIRDEERRYSGDTARTMMYHNKAMASALGAPDWGDLLEVFQFLGPVEDEWEREWRVAHPKPYYSIASSGKDAVADVSPPQGWAQFLNVLKFERKSVLRLMVPTGAGAEMRRTLPAEYRDVEIVEFVD